MTDDAQRILIVKDLMEKLGINAAELCRRTKISSGNMSSMLKGRIPITNDVLVRICLTFPDVNPMFVLNGYPHPILKKDIDYMTQLCKNSAQVLEEIMDREFYNLDEICQQTGIQSYTEVEEKNRGFTTAEVWGLKKMFPSYSLFWIMNGEGPVYDTIYIRMMEFQRRLAEKSPPSQRLNICNENTTKTPKLARALAKN